MFNQSSYQYVEQNIDKRFSIDMSETAYIDELLKAEQAANEIISNAQKERQRKLKEAKQAAEQEVNRYRQQKQAEFHALKERKQDKQFEINLEKETAAEITQIEQDFKANKDKVIDMLVAKVLDVDLTIPSSVKEKFVKKR